MVTNREFYSEIINELKAISIDSWISPYFILAKGRSVFGDFIKKSNDVEQSLYKVSEAWLELECLPLMEVAVSECNLGIGDCKKLMRTKDRIPDTFDSRYGNLIKQVTNINFSNFYEPTTPRGYKNIQKRQDQSKKNYYFFIGGYIYIPVKGDISAPEQVRIELVPQKSWEVAILNNKNKPCIDCKDTCIKPLDYPFICTESLLSAVKQETVKQIAQVYLKVIPDDYPSQSKQNQAPQPK